MSYELLRSLNWIFEIICSTIGIGVFISVIGLLMPDDTPIRIPSENEEWVAEHEEWIKRTEKKNRRRYKLRIWISRCLCLFIFMLGVIKYFGWINFEDVFGGEYKYRGQTLNSKADGYGEKRTLDDELIYKGDFVANAFEGKGEYYNVITMEDGENVVQLKYEGWFHHGLYHGQGKLYDTGKEEDPEKPRLIYDGDFKENIREGTGTYYYDPEEYEGNEWVFEGEFKDGLRDGWGELYLNGELYYAGDFAADMYEGDGEFYDVITNTDGEKVSQLRYEGEFRHGVYSGKGKLYATGPEEDPENPRLVYEGEFKENMYDGQGAYYYDLEEYGGSEWVFKGEFKEGCRHGYGEFYLNGELYESGEYDENGLIENN